ncbi:hypothetical protein [Bythopirellula polymerisocia]|uniref:Fimbrial assembly protein (PilN) n=1 Tax=Bythopirellula polymerisocia TaxID=2528003 RepID=A0A5C6D2M2_9BACT|nr:hypothetical protein [Bythopirellula polymerisocia]TWU29456.1 hypothetical protein Pla144_02340 [Bythopirellula polymerisocia]
MSRTINLMTPYARRREIYRARLRQWLKITSALFLVLALVTSAHYYYVRQIGLEQQLLETMLEPINHLKEANKRLAKQIAAIRDEEQFVLALSSENHTVTVLGLLGSAVAKVGDRVFFEKIELSSSGRTDYPQTNSPMVLDIAGIADNKAAAIQVAEELQSSIPAGKVDVTTNKETRINNLLMHNFALHGTFQN